MMHNNIKMLFAGDFYPGWLPKISIFKRLSIIFKAGRLSFRERIKLTRKQFVIIDWVLSPYTNMNAKSESLLPLLPLKDFLNSYDIKCLNLETSLSNRGKAIHGKEFNLRCAPYFIESLLAAGVNIVSLANNHIIDYGIESLLDTISLLEDFNIKHSGIQFDKSINSQSPAIVNIRNTKIGFLSYVEPSVIDPSPKIYFSLSPAPFALYAENVIEDITAAKKIVDILILMLHWGTEWSHIENSKQREMAHSFIDAGATIIIGHHSHVIQKIEEYRSGLIAYSLGNLYMFLPGISGLRAQKSFALEVVLSNNDIKSYTIHPLHHNDKGQPILENCIKKGELRLPKKSENFPVNYSTNTNIQNEITSQTTIIMRDTNKSIMAKWEENLKLDRIPFKAGWNAEYGLVALGREFCGRHLIDSLVCFSGKFNEIEIKYKNFKYDPRSAILYGFPDWFIKSNHKFDVSLSIILGNKVIHYSTLPWKRGFNVYYRQDKSIRKYKEELSIKLFSNKPRFVCLLGQKEIIHGHQHKQRKKGNNKI